MSRPQEMEPQAGPQPPLVRVTEAVAAQTVRLSQTAFVRATDEVDVVAQLSERITQVGAGFQVGEIVREGDLLVALDPTQSRANQAGAQAHLDQARDALTETKRMLKRQLQLAADDFVSDAALVDAQVAVTRAQANLAMAQAQVERAVLAVNDTRLNVPFDAIVTAQTASRGQFVAAGTPIGHLVAIDSAELRMGLLTSDIVLLGGAEAAVGLPVTLSDPTTGSALRQGRVTGVVPAIEAQTRTTSLIVRVKDPFGVQDAGALRVNDLVQLDLDVTLDQGDTVRISAEALKGSDMVWRVVDGRLTPLRVTLVSREGDVVIVQHADLSDGDTVLLSDLVAPQQGDAVRVVESDPTELVSGR